MASLIFRRQDNAETALGESAPGVLHDVRFDQDTLRILQFEEILDDKWISVGSTDIAWLALHPGQRLEEMVLTDLDVGRSGRALGAAE